MINCSDNSAPGCLAGEDKEAACAVSTKGALDAWPGYNSPGLEVRVMAKVLNDAQIAQYRRDGYLFPFPALSVEELAECNAGLARFEKWLGTPVNQGDFRWRSGSYLFLPWVDALVCHKRILDAVEDLIGPDILVYTATWFIKEANSPAFAAWHQDATYFGLVPNDQHVTAWVALSNASAAAGCMEVASSRGRPRQMRHAALRLANSINGAGQAIVEIGEHTSELQSRRDLVCRLLLEKKKKDINEAK